VNAKLTFELVDYWLSKLTLWLAVHTTDIELMYVLMQGAHARIRALMSEESLVSVPASRQQQSANHLLTH